jgi:hypothetical protein
MNEDVKLDDLKDFSFEAILCSESKRNKKLVAWVCPFMDEMYYKLYHKGEEVEGFNTLPEALEGYNLL